MLFPNYQAYIVSNVQNGLPFQVTRLSRKLLYLPATNVVMAVYFSVYQWIKVLRLPRLDQLYKHLQLLIVDRYQFVLHQVLLHYKLVLTVVGKTRLVRSYFEL